MFFCLTSHVWRERGDGSNRCSWCEIVVPAGEPLPTVAHPVTEHRPPVARPPRGGIRYLPSDNSCGD